MAITLFDCEGRDVVLGQADWLDLPDVDFRQVAMTLNSQGRCAVTARPPRTEDIGEEWASAADRLPEVASADGLTLEFPSTNPPWRLLDHCARRSRHRPSPITSSARCSAATIARCRTWAASRAVRCRPWRRPAHWRGKTVWLRSGTGSGNGLPWKRSGVARRHFERRSGGGPGPGSHRRAGRASGAAWFCADTPDSGCYRSPQAPLTVDLAISSARTSGAKTCHHIATWPRRK